MKKSIYLSFDLKSFITLLLVFILTFSLVIAMNYASITTVSENIVSLRSVIVDAGHGGEDGGTQSSAGVLEK